MRHALLISTLLAGACGGDRTTPVTVPPPVVVPGPDAAPAITPPPVDATPVAPARLRRPAEVAPPPWKRVGVGQTIHWSVAAIDPDLDQVAVRVTKMPASARFDAITQTVSWTPTKADMPVGKFQLELTEVERGIVVDGLPAPRTIDLEIAVDAKRQPAPVAPSAGPVAEALLTIREPARLAQVNKDWPLEKMLVKSAELLRATFAPEVAAKLGKLDGAALYRSVLASLAVTHAQPRIDPALPLDANFAKPSSWQIVTVRPRIDKGWTELRIVYQNVLAPEPAFLMFRLRPTWDVPTLPPEARDTNNRTFLTMVAKHLLDDSGAVSAKLARDAKAHGKAVAALVKELLGYAAKGADARQWDRAALVALPTEARLGGGSARNADGSYAHGDGWAWSVLKPMPSADGTQQLYTSMPIPGFWTDVAPSADGTTYTPRCAPKFDPASPAHVPGYEVLCRKAQGFVDQPEIVDGKVTPAKREAANLFLEYKLVDMVATLPLEDGRRDLGEENGMTCAQCHVRAFGTHDRAVGGNVDPRAGAPSLNAPIPTVQFQIVPGATYETYLVDFMEDQQCRASAHLQHYLGKAGLGCPGA
ncbi:MAG: hypothetical protein R2939_11545 [Kofleriaceae bacterium]